MALTVKKVYIYSLSCPITGDVKYIGKAENPLYRYKKHIEESLRGNNLTGISELVSNTFKFNYSC